MSKSQNHKTQSLTHFVDCLSDVPDPRSKQGVSHPFPTILAITFLGLLANVRTPAATYAS